MVATSFDDAPSRSSEDLRQPVTTFTESIWLDFFTSFSLDNEVQEKYSEAIGVLKDEARSMLIANGNSTAEKLVLIDTIERLGVAYHFENEIEEQLLEIFKTHSHEDEEFDLFTTALQFRLLRQHRHYASCSVFDKFTTELDNKFKETLINDVKGLLSLYEAAHLRIHGEHILDEAVAFTTHHLNRMIQQLESPLQDQVKRALEQPLFRGVSKVENRYFISFYEKNDSKSDLLLKLAKLDFNYVQNIYKKELSELSRLWMEWDLQSNLPYVRVGRVAELFFWGVAHCPEPPYSWSRCMAAKTYQLTGVMDDTYDNYATVEEGALFTELFQRWNIDEIDQLPDYMKFVYKFILSEYDDYKKDAAKLGKSFAVPHAIEAVKQLSRAYIKELRWFMGLELPTFEEYMANTVIVNCNHVYHTMMFLGVESATKEIFEWLMTSPKIVIAAGKVTRHLNNAVSSQRERKEGAIVSPMDIYMKQHGVSQQETLAKFAELAEDGWKEVNAEWITETCIPKNIMEQIINYSRGSELVYRNCKDGYTNPEQMQHIIAALFVDPIII